MLDSLIAREGTAVAIASALMLEFEAENEDDVLAAVRAALAKLWDIGLAQPAEE